MVGTIISIIFFLSGVAYLVISVYYGSDYFFQKNDKQQHVLKGICFILLSILIFLFGK